MQSEPVQRQRLRESCWWHKEGEEKNMHHTEPPSHKEGKEINMHHTKSQRERKKKTEEILNHRGHKEHRESFSAIVSFINKCSEKHQCFLSTY
jgi:hypothetical protein